MPPCTRPQYVPPDDYNLPRNAPFLPVDKKTKNLFHITALDKDSKLCSLKIKKYLQFHHRFPQYVQLPPVPASAKSSQDLQPDLMITTNHQ